jgi:DNA-directed RNA polymerase subunit RPC12/RpoP
MLGEPTRACARSRSSAMLAAMATWRTFACGACGAPRTTLDDTMFIACEHCGAVYDAATQRWFDPRVQTEAFARAHAATFWASTAAGRFARLGEELAALAPDDPRFRARAEEYHYVYTLVYPDRAPARPTARAAWAKQAAAIDAAVRTDPQIAARFEELNDALRAFGVATASADEIVAAARVALERATRAYAALQSHADIVGIITDPVRSARAAVRMSLATMLGTMHDPEVWPRVVTEVFGDRHGAGDECTHCGAPLVELDRDLERCGHCGSVLERGVDDPWIGARVAMFRATLRERHQRGELDTYVTALAAFSFVGSFARAGAERVATYFQRALPWLPAAALERAAMLYRDSLADADRRVFDAAIAVPWTADPSQRPAPPPPPADAFDPEAWLDKARVLWKHSNDHSVLAALVIAIIDILVAQPDARPPITAELVLRFFAEVLDDVPRETVRAELQRGLLGHGEGPAGELVKSIVTALN